MARGNSRPKMSVLSSFQTTSLQTHSYLVCRSIHRTSNGINLLRGHDEICEKRQSARPHHHLAGRDPAPTLFASSRE